MHEALRQGGAWCVPGTGRRPVWSEHSGQQGVEKGYWDKLGSQSTEELCSQNRRQGGWEWEGEREVHRFRVDLGGGTDKTR